MGLIKSLVETTGLGQAGVGALGGTFADQWKEYFYCDSINNNVLVVKGQKKTTGRTANTKGNDNIISNGSVIAVNDGQCMIIVEQGKVVEVCAEPGEFTYDTSTEPSLFTGNLGDSILETFKTVGKRFTFGGDTAKDQRVYYFNTKEILDNKFGTANPFLFRVVNNKVGMDRTVSVRCNGIFSYKISDPLLFYTQVCGNVENQYDRSNIDAQLKSEFISALQPAFAQLSELELRPSQIPAHQTDLENAMNIALRSKWTENRGISVASIALNPITLTEEDLKKIQEIEDAATYGMNAAMMAGRLGTAQANAVETAAGNTAGAMTGFMGMGMAMNQMGNQVQNLYSTAAAQQVQPPKAEANGWKCQCGNTATGNFCPECGAKKPEDGWKCSCGSVNKGKFCSECGAKKPDGAPVYKCDKCGWQPEDPHNHPKFCPECGDIFDENDKN